MKKIYWVLALAIVSSVFFQCRKEVNFIGNPDQGNSVLPDPITASLQGNVVDENGLPAAGVTLTVGKSTAVTDTTGYFRFNNAMLDKNTTLVTVQKTGYFTGYRVFAATSGCNQVLIKLVLRTLSGTVSATSGGSVTLSNGASVTLPANGIVVESSNTVYSGQIQVYAAYINPKSADIGQTIPGSLVANDKNGNRVILSSYGMLAVELQSPGGEKLQIKAGSTATISIPAASLTSAPATISLWYINDSTGIWQEQGTATLQGNVYTGTVTHFTYWNCDYPYSSVTASFTIETADGLPLVNAYVEIIPTDSTGGFIGGMAHGFTDSLGQVTGLVPANVNLTFEVFGSCGNEVYSQNLAPLTANTDLGIFKVNSSNSNILTFTGTLLDCNGMPVTNGEAIIYFEGSTNYASTNAEGQFTTTYVVCDNPSSISVIGIDNVSQQQSSAQIVAVTMPLTNAGNIIACGTSSAEYVNYNLDGTNYSITDSNGYVECGTSLNITGIEARASQSGGNYINFDAVGAIGTGTFSIDTLSVNSYSNVSQIQPFNVTFTNFPTIAGEYYEGTFTGDFLDDMSKTHSLTGNFRIRKN